MSEAVVLEYTLRLLHTFYSAEVVAWMGASSGGSILALVISLNVSHSFIETLEGLIGETRESGRTKKRS